MPPRRRRRSLITVNTDEAVNHSDALAEVIKQIEKQVSKRKQDGDLVDLPDIIKDFVEKGVAVAPDEKDISILELEERIKKHKKEIAKLKKERKENKKIIKELQEENHKLKEDYNRFDILDIRD